MNNPSSKFPGVWVITSFGRSRLHPINAQYLCSSLPHRIYADAVGSILEMTVRPIAQTVVESHLSHGGIIGIRYMTSFDNFVKTIILARDGQMSEINDYGYLDPFVLEDDALYMLLNPVDIGSWYHMPSAEHQQVMQDIGISTQPMNYKQMSQSLEQAIRKTQEEYRFLIRT